LAILGFLDRKITTPAVARRIKIMMGNNGFSSETGDI
jgi:hypothetical protein